MRACHSRRSHRRCSMKKDYLKKPAIFTGKQLYWSLFNKVVDLLARSFILKRLQHRCFPKNIANFLRRPILNNISERLLLFDCSCQITHQYKQSQILTNLNFLCFGSVFICLQTTYACNSQNKKNAYYYVIFREVFSYKFQKFENSCS